MMEHSLRCREAFARYQAEVDTYEQAWPNYCQKCKGWGEHRTTYDPSPAGVGLSPGYMVDIEHCPHCVEKGICPRCSQLALPELDFPNLHDDGPCLYCGWTLKDGGLPEAPACN